VDDIFHRPFRLLGAAVVAVFVSEDGCGRRNDMFRGLE
jgi:hypothetical protein